MNDESFLSRWAEIHKDNTKTPQKPVPVPTLVRISKEFDQLVPMLIGVETSPKLGSQVQLKLRKSISEFADKMLELTDPHVAQIIANEIYYENLKKKMMDKIKDE